MNAYLGLVPLCSDSGGKERHGHINKEFRNLTRTILTQTLVQVVDASGQFRRFYDDLKERRGTGRDRIFTVVDSLLETLITSGGSLKKGLPTYTLESVAGQTWRSHYDEKRNIIVINSVHRDYIFVGRERMRKLRYILHLFAKGLVLHNFVGDPPEQLLEHLLELTTYTGYNIKEAVP